MLCSARTEKFFLSGWTEKLVKGDTCLKREDFEAEAVSVHMQSEGKNIEFGQAYRLWIQERTKTWN
jgi:hypothetical protein